MNVTFKAANFCESLFRQATSVLQLTKQLLCWLQPSTAPDSTSGCNEITQ